MERLDLRYRFLGDRSEAIFRHRHVLPVATWILESGSETITAPLASRGLDGRSAPNKTLQALERLHTIGALRELPFPGRPHPRVFERRGESAFWDLAREYTADVDVDLSEYSDAST